MTFKYRISARLLPYAKVIVALAILHLPVDVALSQLDDAVLGDYVWLDANGDGLQGDPAEEPPVPETLVALLDESGEPIDQTITDANGRYEFLVPPGTYIIEFVPPEGFILTVPNAGNDDTIDSDPDPLTGETSPVTVEAGTANLDVDAGLICGLFIECPSDVALECTQDTDISPSMTGEPTVRACCDVVFIGFVDEVQPGCGDSRTILRRWTAVDACEQTADCTQTIRVIDAFPPVLAGVPADVTVECPDDIPAPPDVSALDECEGPLEVLFTEASDGWLCPGTIMRTWLASDGCGNSSSHTQTIVVHDTTPPELTVQSDLTLQGDANCSVLVPPLEFAADDNCDAQVQVVQDPPAGTVLTGPGTFTVTLTASDACGNETDARTELSVECEALLGDYVWLDTNGDGLQGDPAREPPVPEVAVTLLDASGNAVDQVITDANGQYAFQVSPGIYFVEFAPPAGFAFTVQHAGNDDTIDSDPDPATGRAGPIEVGANMANPDIDAGLLCGLTIACPPDVDLECDPDADTSPSATGEPVVDSCCDVVSVSFLDQVKPVCGSRRIISRTWTAEDSCAQLARCTQTITLVDNSPPTLIGVPPDTEVECGAPLPPPDIAATDTCDPDPVVVLSEQTRPGSCAGTSVITRTWTATDACGNSSTGEQLVTTVDTTNPAISVPADITVASRTMTGPEETGMATATDNCDPDPTVGHTDDVAPGTCPEELVITRTWVASDACGNTDTGNQRITVIAPPSASFTANPLSGQTPLQVQFKDQSDPGSCPITAWHWDFGDGGTSTEPNPGHEYTSPGQYTVTLAVTSQVGSDTETRSDYITVLADVEPGLVKDLLAGPDLPNRLKPNLPPQDEQDVPDGEIDLVLPLGSRAASYYELGLFIQLDPAIPNVLVLDSIPKDWIVVSVAGEPTDDGSYTGPDGNGGNGLVRVFRAKNRDDDSKSSDDSSESRDRDHKSRKSKSSDDDSSKKKQLKHPTFIEWLPDPELPASELVLGVETACKGPCKAGKRKKNKHAPFKCGAFVLNEGAVALMLDENGEVVVDPASGEVLLVFGPTEPIVLVGVKDKNKDGIIDRTGNGDEDGDGILDLDEVWVTDSDPCKPEKD